MTIYGMHLQHNSCVFVCSGLECQSPSRPGSLLGEDSYVCLLPRSFVDLEPELTREQVECERLPDVSVANVEDQCVQY